jgi:hypothetical protein
LKFVVMNVAATPAPPTIALRDNPQQRVFEVRHDTAIEHAEHEPQPKHHQPQRRHAKTGDRQLGR